jgi:hypothetical protein
MARRPGAALACAFPSLGALYPAGGGGGGAGVTNGTLAWDAVTGITQFILRWGEESGSYTEDQNVGNVTSFDIADLVPQMEQDVTYFLVVRSYDGVNENDAYGEIVILNGVQIG